MSPLQIKAKWPLAKCPLAKWPLAKWPLAKWPDTGTDSYVHDNTFEHSAADEEEYALNRCISEKEIIKAVKKS